MTTELEALRNRHIAALRRATPQLKVYDDYWEGEQPMKFIAPEVAAELGDRVTEVVLNWPTFAVEAFDNRLDIEGFRYGGSDSSDDDLWGVWQANDGDLLAQQAHQEHLALSRAYAIVGPGDEPDVPLITAESAFNAIHVNDPRTHDVSSGIKQWTDLDGVRWVSLYTTGGRWTWRADRRDWVLDEFETHDWGLCQLTPLVHRPRILGQARPGRPDRSLGRSVFHDVIPYADAANKMATDMMVSAEYHAMPRRWATGLQKSDFVGEDGQPLDAWQMIAGAVWASEGTAAKFGQFPEADLAVFHNSIKLLAQLAAQQLGLPPHYLSFVGDNPASADAIRSSEAQLVKRVERIQQHLSTRWERVQRLVLLTSGRPDSPEARRIETLWRDPSTPTVAQKADAIVKLVAVKDGTGRSLLPIQQAREDLGYTAEQQARMADWDRQDAVDPQVEAATRALQTAGSTLR